MARRRFWTRNLLVDQGHTGDGQFPYHPAGAGGYLFAESYLPTDPESTVLRTMLDVVVTCRADRAMLTTDVPWWGNWGCSIAAGVYASGDPSYPTFGPEEQPQVILTGELQYQTVPDPIFPDWPAIRMQNVQELQSQGQRKSTILGEAPVVRVIGRLDPQAPVFDPDPAWPVFWEIRSYLRVLFESAGP